MKRLKGIIGFILFISILLIGYSTHQLLPPQADAQSTSIGDKVGLPSNYENYSFCGDGICAAAYGETSATCSPDCGASTLTSTGFCRTNADCSNTQVCGANSQCVDLTTPTPTPTSTALPTPEGANRCRSTADCPVNYTCNIPLNQCEGIASPTVTNTPTPTTFSCGNDAVCPTNYVCNTSTRQCVPQNTPTNTSTPTFTITPTLAPNFTPTNTNTPTPTLSPTPTGYCHTDADCPNENFFCNGLNRCALKPTNTLTPTQSPTPTFTITPTLFPEYTPTNTITPTVIHTSTPTTTPTLSPTPIEITQEPTSTPGDTFLSLNLKLPAIGSLSCISLPTASGSGDFDIDGNNCLPVNDSRSAIVQFVNASDQKVAESVASLQFDGYSYRGTTSANLESGTYSVYVSMDNTLVKRLPAILAITKGSTVAAPSAQLVSGDIDQNNILDLFDWNAVTDCYNNPACGTNFPLSDLNDDGKVDEIDVNILSRGFAIRDGDSNQNITEIPISPTPSPTGIVACSPPHCSSNQTLVCPLENGCPYGCGEICKNIAIDNPISPTFSCNVCSTDVNGNGRVDILDSKQIDQCLNSSSPNCQNADVNRDGVINSGDVLCYQNYSGQVCTQ